ncbi:hypothetical protein ES705_28923 [subsurface metagenome]
MKCNDLWEIFLKENITFFTGVPDSTFKHWMNFLDYKGGDGLTNVIASNECEAIAIASGYYLATQEIGVVYMQNAGLGKAVNPLASLTDPEVYSIPILLMIGWRGEPSLKDEPQHKKMGRITLSLLDVLEIPYDILPKDRKKAEEIIRKAKNYAQKNNAQYALIIRKKTIESFPSVKLEEEIYKMSREEVIEVIINNVSPDTVIISTTGKTSRELFELRINRREKPSDFYTVGSMGCAAAIAFGIAENTIKDTLILDGDGSALMQMGTLATIGHYKPSNLYHIIFNNRSHESTGGQPTVSETVDFEKVALSCGYRTAHTIDSRDELIFFLSQLEEKECPCLIVVNIRKGSRENLGRPTATPQENKESFMKLIKDEN